jgi:chorismate mutase
LQFFEQNQALRRGSARFPDLMWEHHFGPRKFHRRGFREISQSTLVTTRIFIMWLAVDQSFPSFEALQAAWFAHNQVLQKQYKILEKKLTKCFRVNCISAPSKGWKGTQSICQCHLSATPIKGDDGFLTGVWKIKSFNGVHTCTEADSKRKRNYKSSVLKSVSAPLTGLLLNQTTVTMAPNQVFPSFNALQSAWFAHNQVLQKQYKILEKKLAKCFRVNCVSAPSSRWKGKPSVCQCHLSARPIKGDGGVLTGQWLVRSFNGIHTCSDESKRKRNYKTSVLESVSFFHKGETILPKKKRKVKGSGENTNSKA